MLPSNQILPFNRRYVFVALCIGSSLVMSVCFPLLTYSVTIALFGLAHVASELRFVDQRFSQRLKGSFTCGLILLMGIIGTRSAMVFGFAQAHWAYNIELALVLLLATSALFYSRASLIPTLVVVLLLFLGFLYS